MGSYPSLLQQVPDFTICGDNFISPVFTLVSSSRSEMIIFSFSKYTNASHDARLIWPFESAIFPALQLWICVCLLISLIYTSRILYIWYILCTVPLRISCQRWSMVGRDEPPTGKSSRGWSTVVHLLAIYHKQGWAIWLMEGSPIRSSSHIG